MKRRAIIVIATSAFVVAVIVASVRARPGLPMTWDVGEALRSFAEDRRWEAPWPVSSGSDNVGHNRASRSPFVRVWTKFTTDAVFRRQETVALETEVSCIWVVIYSEDGEVQWLVLQAEDGSESHRNALEQELRLRFPALEIRSEFPAHPDQPNKSE